jgi:2-keto-3-deoxy-L-rhamnonate aldolase RhmA
MRVNQAKRTLAAGGVAFGTMVFEFATPGIGRLVAGGGADFVVYDMEHSGLTLSEIKGVLAQRHGDTAAVVRIPTLQYHLLAGAMDAGAMGIMVPMVETPAQAAAIVQYAKYHPEGGRGCAFGMAHDDYAGGDVVATMAQANAEGWLIAQIETRRGLQHVDEIAATPGIDCLWVGHFDLTQSLGIPARFDHPAFLAGIEAVARACARHGKAAGILVGDPAEAETWLRRGYRALAYGVDSTVYRMALASGIGRMRALVSKEQGQ